MQSPPTRAKRNDIKRPRSGHPPCDLDLLSDAWRPREEQQAPKRGAVIRAFHLAETCRTDAHTDTYHGHFVRLVTNEQVVESLEFETTDPALRGKMTITTTLADVDGGTNLLVVHEGIPNGVSTTDNETGTQMSLANLAALVEAG